MSKIKAVNGHIVINPLEAEEQMNGNIVLPDLGENRPNVGTIISTSDIFNFNQGEYVPTIFKPGMKVFYPGGFGGTVIHLEGEEYILIQAQSILGILEEK